MPPPTSPRASRPGTARAAKRARAERVALLQRKAEALDGVTPLPDPHSGVGLAPSTQKPASRSSGPAPPRAAAGGEGKSCKGECACALRWVEEGGASVQGDGAASRPFRGNASFRHCPSPIHPPEARLAEIAGSGVGWRGLPRHSGHTSRAPRSRPPRGACVVPPRAARLPRARRSLRAAMSAAGAGPCGAAGGGGCGAGGTSMFRWLEVLEKEFDKAFVDMDLLLGEIDPDQADITYDGRQKMTSLSSCFAQLCHKAQTVSQINHKLEVGGGGALRDGGGGFGGGAGLLWGAWRGQA